MAKGLCHPCYFADYVPRNSKVIKGYKDKWYENFKKEGGLELMKTKRELDHFDGMREAALKRDSYECVRCKARTKLAVHHKDGQGRNVPREDKNNTLENLETLCRSCHMIEHSEKIKAARAKRLNFWSPKHKLKACIECNSDRNRHSRDGYCGTCWARIRKQMQKLGTYKPKPPGGAGEPWK